MNDKLLDDVLRDEYYMILIDKLDDTNIIIDDKLEVENSKDKYIQEFALFLHQAEIEGYKMDGYILKKLMDIIEFEGYEYQIMMQYKTILNKAIVTTGDATDATILPVEDAISYINHYLSLDEHKVPVYGKPAYRFVDYILTPITKEDACLLIRKTAYGDCYKLYKKLKAADVITPDLVLKDMVNRVMEDINKEYQ